MKIIEEVKCAFEAEEIDKELTASEIKEKVYSMFGRNKSSVIPSDYCYNRCNKGIDIEKNLFEERCLFEYLEEGRYKYKGTKFSYTGPLYCKPQGEDEYIVAYIKNNKLYSVK